jgi:hypothetical protein
MYYLIYYQPQEEAPSYLIYCVGTVNSCFLKVIIGGWNHYQGRTYGILRTPQEAISTNYTLLECSETPFPIEYIQTTYPEYLI